MNNFEKYHHDLNYSYAYGAFVCIELLKKQKDKVIAIIVSPSFIKNEAYQKILSLTNKIIIDDHLLNKLRQKENTYVIGVFKKYSQNISTATNHLVLNNIVDVGIIGTIIRSMNGFDFHDLVLIGDEYDCFDPQLIRSSMGAFFSIRIQVFPSLEDYLKNNKNQIYVLNKNQGKKIENLSLKQPYSILFNFSNLDKYENIYFPENLNLENIVNIIIYNLYQKK